MKYSELDFKIFVINYFLNVLFIILYKAILFKISQESQTNKQQQQIRNFNMNTLIYLKHDNTRFTKNEVITTLSHSRR